MPDGYRKAVLELNPRNARDKLGPFVGKKVMVGTTDWHYISGRVEVLENSGHLQIAVNGKIVLVPPEMIATIEEAHDEQAEYIK